MGVAGRIFFLLSLSLATVPMFAAAGLTVKEDNFASFWILVLAGGCTANGAYQTFYVYVAERLPTSHRAQGLGVGNGVSKLAAVLGPPAFSGLVAAGCSYGGCLVVLGVASASAAGLLAATSAETLGKALTDRPTDADDVLSESTPLLC